MCEAKFTKGEWVADIRGGCCAVYEKSRENDTPGMHFDDDRNIYYSSHEAKYNGHHWEMSPEAIANANLIAAAPEMYNEIESDVNILIGLLQEFDKFSTDYLFYSSELERKQQLLSKARGEHA